MCELFVIGESIVEPISMDWTESLNDECIVVETLGLSF